MSVNSVSPQVASVASSSVCLTYRGKIQDESCREMPY